MSGYSIVFTTAPNIKEARIISQALLKAKLAACVNIIKEVESLFWWQGEIDKASEILLIIKTRKRLFGRIEKLVSRIHSYDTPEVISFDLEKISQKYLRWLDATILKSS